MSDRIRASITIHEPKQCPNTITWEVEFTKDEIEPYETTVEAAARLIEDRGSYLRTTCDCS